MSLTSGIVYLFIHPAETINPIIRVRKVSSVSHFESLVCYLSFSLADFKIVSYVTVSIGDSVIFIKTGTCL